MANQFVFANNVKTTVGATFSNTATTLTLSSSANLPTLAAGQLFPITLNDAATGLVYEIMYATAISGANLTVTRAQEGTTAQNWAVGDHAYCAFTAGTVAPESVVSNVQAGSYSYAVDTGTVNAITIGLNPTPAELTDGMQIRVKVAVTNTGAVTINTNGLGAVAVESVNGALGAGTLVAGTPYIFVYSVSLAAWVLQGVDALFATNATNATNVAGSAVVTNGIGYATGVGVGGSVTQTTSITTGVTLNKLSGTIITVAFAPTAGTAVQFLLSNSLLVNGDTLSVSMGSGGNSSNFMVSASCGNNFALITLYPIASAASNVVNLYFNVIKGSTN